MAGASTLLDRICALTGLPTSAGTERTLVLNAAQDAYHRAVEESGCWTGTFSWSLTAGTADYTLGTAPISTTDILRIKHMWLTDGSVTNRPVKVATEEEIRHLRHGSSVQGSSYRYAIQNPLLFLYPTPGTGVTLAGTYVKEPTALADNSTAPTAFPARFHYDVIVNGATALVMEYKRQPEARNYHEQFEKAVSRLTRWAEELAGDSPTGFAEDDWAGYSSSRRAGYYP